MMIVLYIFIGIVIGAVAMWLLFKESLKRYVMMKKVLVDAVGKILRDEDECSVILMDAINDVMAVSGIEIHFKS